MHRDRATVLCEARHSSACYAEDITGPVACRKRGGAASYRPPKSGPTGIRGRMKEHAAVIAGGGLGLTDALTTWFGPPDV